MNSEVSEWVTQALKANMSVTIKNADIKPDDHLKSNNFTQDPQIINRESIYNVFMDSENTL